jgi:hypothetical protein
MDEITLEFKLSKEAFNLLIDISINKTAEYRDTNFNSLEEFKLSEEFKTNKRSIASFLDRNFNGTYYLIDELLKYGLVDTDYDCKYITYVTTEFGEECLKKYDNKKLD